MPREITCKHCGNPFIPKPNKPGFINECPDCLEERSPKIAAPPAVRAPNPKAKKRPRHFQSAEALERSILRSTNELCRLLGNDPELKAIADRFKKSIRRVC